MALNEGGISGLLGGQETRSSAPPGAWLGMGFPRGVMRVLLSFCPLG